MKVAEETTVDGEERARAPWRRRPGRLRLPGRTGEIALVFLGQFAFVCFATWPLLPSMATKAVIDLGDPMLTSWLFGWGVHAAVEAPLRVFDANMYHPVGLSLAFTENMLGMALPTAPVIWLTDNALLAYNLALVTYVAVAGVGAYVLARELGAPRLLAFACGVAYALTPYRLVQFSHAHVVGTHLLPFVVLLLLRLSDPTVDARAARRRVVALTLVVAFQVWASLTGAAMIAIVVLAWFAWCVVRYRRQVLRPLVRVGVGLLAALVLCVPVALPYFVLRDRFPDYRHPKEEALVYSAQPWSYLASRTGGPFVGDIYGELSQRFNTPPRSGEVLLFPGIWLIVASVAGFVLLVLHRFRDAGIAVFGLVLGAVAFVFSLGPRVNLDPDGFPLPFLLMQNAFGGLTRVPARMGIVVPLGMAMVAAAGLTRLRPRVRTAVAVVSLVALAVEFAPRILPLVEAPPVTAAHRAVADREGAVLGLPMPEMDDNGVLRGPTLAVDAQHLYLSTAHFRPLVNGYAAYAPPSYWDVVAVVQRFPSEEAFYVLRARDVRTVIVQTDLVAKTTRWPQVVERLRAWPGVVEIGSGEGVLVFDVTGATARARVAA